MPVLFRRLVPMTVATVVAAAGAAHGAALEECEKLAGRAAIAPCTLVIDGENENAASRAFAYLLRARAALDASDFEKAEADLGAGLALRPNNAFGYRVRGRLRGLQGRNDDARADYTKALQLSETPASKYVSYVDRGQFFVRTKELADALADFDAAIALDRAKAHAHVGRAVVHKAMGRIDDALAGLDTAASVEPTFWLTYVERGDILLAQKRNDDALAAYNLALARRPGDARALRGRAAAEAAGAATATKKDESEPTKTAMPETPAAPATASPPTDRPGGSPIAPSGGASDPTNQGAELRRKNLQAARELREARKFQEALTIHDAMLRAAPTDAEVAIEKGRTLMQMMRWSDAIETFKSVIDSKVTSDALKAGAFAYQSEIFGVNNQFDRAINAAGEALRINPRLEGALFWRGFSLYATGAFAAALADFKQAGSMLPKSPVYPSWEALVFIGAGDTAKAKEAIERAIAIQPDNVDALLARTRLKLAAGDIAAAEADFSQVQRRSAPTPVAVQTQQLIMLHKILKPSDAPATSQSR
jgi:tetratricopeptide (TPR) repeat protein